MYTIRRVCYLNELCAWYENVCKTQIIDPSNTILLHLRIKLGLMTNFVKAMNKSSNSFKGIQNLFPKLSVAKLNAKNFEKI